LFAIRIEKEIMKKYSHILMTILFVAVISLTACRESAETSDDDWVARVGATVITLEDIEFELAALAKGGLLPEEGSPELLEVKQSVLDELIETKLLLAEAKRRQIVVSPDEISESLELAYGSSESDKLDEVKETTGLDAARLREKVSDALYIEKLFTRDIYPRILMSDEELKKEYESNLESYYLPERVKVRQIVLATEEEATAALRRIWRGESFAALANELSIMPEKSKGGDLGWIKKGEYPEPLDELFFTLPKRTYNRPVKSSFGYHIIHITNHKRATQLSFEDAERLVEKSLYRKKKQLAGEDLIESLTARYKVIINPKKSIVESKK